MTATETAPLRLLRAPAAEPPYDDERVAPAATVGALALAFPPQGATVPLRLVPPALDENSGSRPTTRATLPDPQRWTGRLAQAIAEVLAGQRPAGQLSRFATLDVLGLLERSAGRLTAAAGPAALRPVVMSVHVDEPADGVAEACAVLDTGPRRRAVALRLEGIDGRWQCTALQVC